MSLHLADVMKDVVMMIGEMIVDHLAVMMVVGGVGMKEEVDQGMIVVVTRVGMKMVGVAMTEEMPLQEETSKRGKWMKKDLKQFVLDVKLNINYGFSHTISCIIVFVDY